MFYIYTSLFSHTVMLSLAQRKTLSLGSQFCSKVKVMTSVDGHLHARLPRCHIKQQETGVSVFWSLSPVKATKILSGDPVALLQLGHPPETLLLNFTVRCLYSLNFPDGGLNSNIYHFAENTDTRSKHSLLWQVLKVTQNVEKE